MSKHHGEPFQGPIKKDHDRQRHVVGKEPAGFLVCSQCRAVFHNKHWQWNATLLAKHSGDKKTETIYPACKITRKEEAEGVLELAGFVSEGQKQEILGLLKNAGQRAAERDPLDRIFAWDDAGKKIVVYTTENQLAISLGKQVKRAFNGELDISSSKNADVVKVKWQGWMG